LGGYIQNKYLVPFAKMHGIGNDLIFIDAEDLAKSEDGKLLLKQWHKFAPAISADLCHRHFGIGGDGLVLSLDLKDPFMRSLAEEWYGKSAQRADLAWTYTNSDGSWSDICGNGLRCLALWRYEKGTVDKSFTVLTAAGLAAMTFESKDAILARLDKPRLASKDIPCQLDGGESFNESAQLESVIRYPLKLKDRTINVTLVNVGNPHCVIFEPELLKQHRVEFPIKGQVGSFFPQVLSSIAKEIQQHKTFPENVNVEFVWPLSANKVECLVWERGSGPTLACGTAALAVLVAGVLEGKLERSADILLPGGTVNVSWNEKTGQLEMKGPARIAFTGRSEIPAEVISAVRNTCSVAGAK
jgi:diaminopimelate epimerase